MEKDNDALVDSEQGSAVQFCSAGTCGYLEI